MISLTGIFSAREAREIDAYTDSGRDYDRIPDGKGCICVGVSGWRDQETGKFVSEAEAKRINDRILDRMERKL